jgi:SAM-dependent methyltransferase
MDLINEFNTYRQSIGDRTGMYQILASTFNIETALYPGSHIDIMPSFVIPSVTYIDSFKGAIKFFEKLDDIYDLINQHKDYESSSVVAFIEGDYKDYYDLEEVDLIISQFAGFVGQDTKRYLKKGGILLCNDSHGDATLAYCDEDYELIAIVTSENTIEMDNLDQYFQYARKRPIDLEKVRLTMKGPKYKHRAANYIFRKV